MTDDVAFVGNFSVSQYTVKKGNEVNQKSKHDYIEHLFVHDIRYGIENLLQHIPLLPELIPPMLQTAHTMQSMCGNINLKETPLSNAGIWKATIAIDGITKELHSEDDCTYTVIHVPKQENQGKYCVYNFQFCLNSKQNIAIPLHECTTIIFSGLMLTHG